MAIEGYTTAYYHQWFEEKMRATPKQHQQQLRLKQAKTLLYQTNLSILQIAQ